MPLPTIPSGNVASEIGGAYEVANSCRFDGSNDYMSKTPSSNGDAQKFTTSLWFKRGNLGTDLRWYEMGDLMLYSGTNIIGVANRSFGFDVYTESHFLRDVSAWYHMVVAVDTTQGTAANRVKIYLNGTQITSSNGLHSSTSYPSLNENLDCNQSSEVHRIGARSDTGASKFDGYMAEFVHIDGSQLAATDFGEYDEDSPTIWKPKDVSGLSGSKGTNGFYLDFEDSSNLGNDVWGGTDLSETGIGAIDQCTDTPTNNFATLNSQNGDGTRTDGDTYSEGNTIMIPSGHDTYTTTFATMGAKKGKWYWEAQSIVEGTASNAYYPRTIGFMRDDYGLDKSTLGQDDDKTWDVVYNGGNWDASHNNSVVVNDMSTDRTSGNILNFALDLDNGKFYFGINGTYLNSGNPTSGSSGTGSLHTLDATDLSHFIIPAVTNATTGTYYKFNFGNPAFSISSGNADGNGYGNFEYAPPSGYFAWCTKNLAEQG